MEKKEISKAVLKRLPGYLTYLRSLPEGSAPYISATALAAALGMGEVQVRKDLAMVSDGGRPKIGYQRESLIEDIEQFLGYDNATDAVLIGAGKLGQALLGYKGFAEYGLNILAAFDVAPKSGHTEDGKPIYPGAIRSLWASSPYRRPTRSRFATSLSPVASRPSGALPPPIWRCRTTSSYSTKTWRPRWLCFPCTCRHKLRKKSENFPDTGFGIGEIFTPP